MVNGNPDSPSTTDGDFTAWKSEVTGFLQDAKRELRTIIDALQTGNPIEPAPRFNKEPVTTYTPERTVSPEPVPQSGATAAPKPADHDDRLEQLKRRIEEQLRTAERK